MAFKRNIGGFDRILRIGISLLMLYFGFINNTVITDSFAGTLLGVFGIGGMIVALVGFCPLYSVIGFSTCPVAAKS